MAQVTLDELFQNEPAAKKSVLDSAGYAVFSDFGNGIFISIFGVDTVGCIFTGQGNG